MKKIKEILIMSLLILAAISFIGGCTVVNIKICQAKYIGATWYGCLLSK